MNLCDYLIPVNNEPSLSTRSGTIGRNIITYGDDGGFKIPASAKVALLGVPEDRFSDGAGEIKLPEQVRKQLYALSSDAENVVDLGNLRTGKTLLDTYFCLQHVVSELHAHGMVTVLIGGTIDLFYGGYLAFEGRKINLTGIIPSLRLPEQGEEQHPLNRMIFEDNPEIHYCNIGYQSYYVHQQELDALKEKFAETYRLGEATWNIADMEPVMRDSDIIALSMNAVKYADAPAASITSPNGFTGEEVCQLAFYAGLSHRCKCMGIFDALPQNDMQHITAKLIAQIVWYFIEGIKGRNTETPETDAIGFKKYVIYYDQLHHDLCFYKHIKTNRWWMEVPSLKGKQHNEIISCTQEDYAKATEQEIPNRWWKIYQKIN
ncbi:MAG: hypothetical protein LBS09_07955 [Bacteroidales bacterium]|jgi:arginase family enzyme|nr:hypothetical protein [Bacteroidales bacterium]